MELLTRLIERWKLRQEPKPVPAHVYGRTLKCRSDPSGLIRFDIQNAHRDEGGKLLPSLHGCKWIILSPTEMQMWAPLNSYSQQDLLRSEYLIGALVESDAEELSHERIVQAARLLPLRQGDGIALAFYDLRSATPQLYIPDRYWDQLEDEWQFELEDLGPEKTFRFPSYDQLFALIVAGDGSAVLTRAT